MRLVNGRSVLRSSPLYCILMANFAVAAPTLARHGCGVAVRASSAGPDCELCRGGSLFDCRPSLLQPSSGAATGSPKRRPRCRRLIPSFEHVTCREPTVTPMSSAISCRLFPFSTRFLICPTFSRVNFFCPAIWVILRPMLVPAFDEPEPVLVHGTGARLKGGEHPLSSSCCLYL
jgi:hypothetical protein